MKQKNYMDIAFQEAKKAYNLGEVPVGAVIVLDNKVLAKAYNKKEKKKNVLEHAEIRAIKQASKKMKNWRLNNCEIYVTLYPCPMCASAIQQARIKNVFYAVDPQDESIKKIDNQIFQTSQTNIGIENVQKIENADAQKLLQNFFKKRR